MANLALIYFSFVSLVSCGLALTMNEFLGLGNLRQAQTEEPRVVEIIRWRQPVCITPAPGVLPCMVSLANSQASNHVHEDYSTGYPHQYRRRLPEENKPSEDDLLKKLTQDDSAPESTSLESLEDDDVPAKRSARETPTPKLYSPRVVRSVRLDRMGASRLAHPSEEDARRRGRYLKLGAQMGRTAPRRQTVYVTKVVDSPVVATLVAATCLPDIGIPICDEVQNPHQRPGHYQEHQGAVNPGFITGGTPPIGNVNANDAINHWTTVNNSSNGSGQQQNFVQNVFDFVNRPDVVQTNETPDVRPVVVVQPTPPSGLLEGISAFLMPNGSWFGVPGLGQLPQLPQLPQFPQLPQLPQPPQVPSLQQFLYRPENDISNPPSVLNVFNLTSNHPGAGPPTQSPGIFGGLFASPARPDGFSATSATTSTTASSLLDGIGNIFRPTRRPLVIQNPNERPIVIERPVYVAEQPVIPGIFDIFQNPNRTVQLNSNEEPQVIKDPVYVLQRPNENQPFFGLLPSIFGTSSSTPSTTTSTSAAPAVPHNQQPYPAQPNVNGYASTYQQPVVAPVNSHLPPFPDPPNVIPGYVHVDSVQAVSTVSSSNPQPYGYSKSAGFAKPESYAGSLAAVETSEPDSVYSGINLEESSTTPETDLGESDLLDGSLTEIVHAEGGVEGSGVADEDYAAEDVSDTSSTTEGETREGYKNIEVVGKEKEIENEA